MNEKLFDHLNIDKNHTYVPLGTGDYVSGAKEYDALIAKAGGIDLQLLGVGTNGHVGFNEPPADFNSLTGVVDLVETTIQANARFFVSANEVPKQAVSMGIKSILNAKKIILIANGSNKAQAIKQLVEGEINNLWPCTALQMHQDVTVVVDKTAAGLLQSHGININ